MVTFVSHIRFTMTYEELNFIKKYYQKRMKIFYDQ